MKKFFVKVVIVLLSFIGGMVNALTAKREEAIKEAKEQTDRMIEFQGAPAGYCEEVRKET